MQGQAWPAAGALSGVFSSFKLILPFHIPPQAGQRVGGPERIRKQPLRQGAEPQMALIGLPADDLKLQLCGLGEKKGEVRPPGLIPEAESRRMERLAEDFRARIKDLPLEEISESPSNAMTALHPLRVPAYRVYEILKEEYGIFVCPNGGALRDEIFRVGHLGALTEEDNKVLSDALHDMERRGLL